MQLRCGCCGGGIEIAVCGLLSLGLPRRAGLRRLLLLLLAAVGEARGRVRRCLDAPGFVEDTVEEDVVGGGAVGGVAVGGGWGEGRGWGFPVTAGAGFVGGGVHPLPGGGGQGGFGGGGAEGFALEGFVGGGVGCSRWFRFRGSGGFRGWARSGAGGGRGVVACACGCEVVVLVRGQGCFVAVVRCGRGRHRRLLMGRLARWLTERRRR